MFSLLGIIILLPIMFFICIYIKLFSSTPIFFKQKRVGLNGITFSLYKFCTMKENCMIPSSHLTVQGNPRITKTGRVLRRFKLDELPSLFNVLKGDMSFVGPRPWVKHYINKLDNDEKKFLLIRPGITSPATLKYANEEYLLSDKQNPEKYHDDYILPDKVKLNLSYLDSQTLLYDVIIIFKTIFRQNY
mgnify:CR=1 FL=1